MKKILILIFTLFEFSSALAENIDSISVVGEEWPHTTNSDGTGAYWEILKLVYEPVGIKVNTLIMPWKRAKEEVRMKRVDALVGDYYEANSSDYFYPKWHITVEYPVVAIFKKGRIKNWESVGLKSLEDKRVTWIRGYDFDTVFLKGIDVLKQEVTNDMQGMQLIASGRQEVYLDYEPHVRHVAKKLNINLDIDYEIKTAKPGSKLYVTFRKTEQSKELVSIFDNRMTQLANSGKIEKIYVKWGLKAEKFGKERFSNP